jgi:hypothetical protein
LTSFFSRWFSASAVSAWLAATIINRDFTRAVASGTTSTRRRKQLGLDMVKITDWGWSVHGGTELWLRVDEDEAQNRSEACRSEASPWDSFHRVWRLSGQRCKPRRRHGQWSNDLFQGLEKDTVGTVCYL